MGHSSTATSMMTSYLIGVVEGSDPSDAAQFKQKSEEVEGGFVAVKTSAEEKPSAFMSLVEFLIPLLIVGVAFGAWYYYNKERA